MNAVTFTSVSGFYVFTIRFIFCSLLEVELKFSIWLFLGHITNAQFPFVKNKRKDLKKFHSSIQFQHICFRSFIMNSQFYHAQRSKSHEYLKCHFHLSSVRKTFQRDQPSEKDRANSMNRIIHLYRIIKALLTHSDSIREIVQFVRGSGIFGKPHKATNFVNAIINNRGFLWVDQLLRSQLLISFFS